LQCFQLQALRNPQLSVTPISTYRTSLGKTKQIPAQSLHLFSSFSRDIYGWTDRRTDGDNEIFFTLGDREGERDVAFAGMKLRYLSTGETPCVTLWDYLEARDEEGELQEKRDREGTTEINKKSYT
jgi:hypothetical protein